MGLKIVALHGFMGAPSDWAATASFLPQFEWITPDYTQDAFLNPEASDLGVWGKKFRQWAEANNLKEIILIGYSQGARLALHALKETPELFQKVVVVSGQPGISETDFNARESRHAHDAAWAKKFEIEPWSTVLHEWNAQDVFLGSRPTPLSDESAERRKMIATSLRAWSVSHQEDFRPVIKEYAEKIVWVVGEKDSKYIGISNELRKNILGLEVLQIPKAGHRVLLDQPSELGKALKACLL